MGIINLALAKCDATDAGSQAIEQEIQPVEEEKVKFTKMLLNGTGSRVDQRARAAKGKAKAKAKERKVAMEIELPNLFVTIGARGMGTAATLPPATSLMMVLKEERKEKEKDRRHCPPKPSRKQRKKLWQW